MIVSLYTFILQRHLNVFLCVLKQQKNLQSNIRSNENRRKIKKKRRQIAFQRLSTRGEYAFKNICLYI